MKKHFSNRFSFKKAKISLKSEKSIKTRKSIKNEKSLFKLILKSVPFSVFKKIRISLYLLKKYSN